MSAIENAPAKSVAERESPQWAGHDYRTREERRMATVLLGLLTALCCTILERQLYQFFADRSIA